MHFPGKIEKIYKNDQGHLIVCGHASTEALDAQGEIVKAEAMRNALQEYMKVGNVREMHQPSAVGKTMVAEQDDLGTYIEVKVVDPIAAMKCEEGVYTGFSIGGKYTGRDTLNKNIITGIRLTEISLVDRPCNPEATFTLFKLDDELADELNVEPEVIMPVEKTEGATELQKGMVHVAELSYLLKQLAYLVDDQANEAAREGDGSPVPAALQGWLTTGAEILRNMTAEESAELVAAAGQDLLPTTDDVPVLEMAEKTEGLEKRGAKFSQETKDQLIALHDTLIQNLGQLHSLLYPAEQTDLNGADADAIANPNVYAQPEGERGETGTPQGFRDSSPNATESRPLDATTISGARSAGKADLEMDMKKLDDLQKTHDEAMAKITDLTSDLEKLNSDKEALQKRVSELEAQPAPAKARLLSLSKAEDVVVSEVATKAEALLASKNPVDIMKGVFMTGGTPGYSKGLR